MCGLATPLTSALIHLPSSPGPAPDSLCQADLSPPLPGVLDQSISWRQHHNRVQQQKQQFQLSRQLSCGGHGWGGGGPRCSSSSSAGAPPRGPGRRRCWVAGAGVAAARGSPASHWETRISTHTPGALGSVPRCSKVHKFTRMYDVFSSTQICPADLVASLQVYGADTDFLYFLKPFLMGF